VTLLGNQADRINYAYPPKDKSRIAISYRITPDTDAPYDEDTDYGRITETVVEINSYHKSTKTELSDDVHALVKEILTSKLNLTTNYIICYSATRIGQPYQRFDDEEEEWITGANYRIVWAQRETVTLSYEIDAKASIAN
jgi:hypothetical protein